MLALKRWTVAAALGGLVLFGARTDLAAQQQAQAPKDAKALAAQLGLSAEEQKQLGPDLDKLSNALARHQMLQSQATQVRTDMQAAVAKIITHLTPAQRQQLRSVMLRSGGMGAMHAGARGGMMGRGMTPGAGQGMGPGMHQGMMQGMAPGMHQGMMQGMAPGMHQGMKQGMKPGMHQGMKQGMAPGMGAGPAGQGCPPADTTGAGPSQGPGGR